MKICNNHKENPVPLVPTMAFRGAEYWCPACGATHGIFNACEDVEETEELLQVARKYKEKTQDYLSAKSAFACTSLMHEGKRISPHDLPKEIIDKYSKVIEEFSYDY